MAIHESEWGSEYIGKTIYPVAVEKANSNGANITSSRGIYRMTFKPLNNMLPHLIELSIFTKKKVIKRLTVKIYALAMHDARSGSFYEYPFVPEDRDDEMLRQILTAITIPVSEK